MENKNWQLASTFTFFLNKRTWKMKIYVQFFFFFQKCENLCSIFFFFLDIEKWKNKTKKRKENVYLLLFFSEKWRIINLWSIFNENKLHAWCFFFVFCFCSVPRSSLAGTKQHGDNRESPWQRRDDRGYCVILD